MIDQIGEDIALLKNRLETCRNPRIQQVWKEDLARLAKRERTEFKALVAAIREHRDLAERLDLIYSVSGAGLPTAVAILVRMPEIGQLTREQAAALAGLAPYDDDSGKHVGVRHIDGGRERLRRALYTAALPASFRWNPQLITLYKRLIAAGKGTSTRSSPAPESCLFSSTPSWHAGSVRGGQTKMQTSGARRRENANVYSALRIKSENSSVVPANAGTHSHRP